MSAGSVFGLSVSAVGFVVAGFAGYDFHRTVGHPYGRWTDSLVVWEIAVGIVCGVVAAYGWRAVLRRGPTQRNWSKKHTVVNVVIVGAALAFVVWTTVFP